MKKLRFKRNISKLLVFSLFICFLIFVLSGSGAERRDFLPLEQIEPGMEGVGKTVVQGNIIESFHVKVVDIIESSTDLFSFILVRVSGGAIAKSGGIAGGMSGSPIYIDGKVIGALSRSVYWQESPEPLAWITPIETMFKLVDSAEQGLRGETNQPNPSAFIQSELGYSMVGSKARLASASARPRGQSEVGSWKYAKDESLPVSGLTGRPREVRFVPQSPSSEELRDNPQTLYAVDLPLASIVGGLSQRAFTWLKEGLDPQLLEENRKNLMPGVGQREILEGFLRAASRGLSDYHQDLIYSPGTGPAQETGAGDFSFEPGAPLGALLMTGDDYYGWFGTVTYKENIPVEDGNKSAIVGLGHPMLEQGESHYFLNPITILDTVDTLEGPFKLGAPIGIPGSPVISGVISEDRYQGIAGVIGAQTQSIKLNLQVRDEDRDIENDYHVDLVPMRDFYPIMTLIAGYDEAYSTINRTGQGTMRVHYTIRGLGMPRDLERDDIFVNSEDIALTGPLQIARIAYLLAWNEFKDPQITEIDAELSITKELQTVVIEEIQTDKNIYKPGDELHYEVTLQSHRGKQKVVKGRLEIPEKFLGGEVTVWAVPASEAEAVGAYRKGWTRPMPTADSLKDLIENAESLAKGDTLYVFFEGIPAAIQRDYLSDSVCSFFNCAEFIIDRVDVTELGLEGEVTGHDHWSIMVQK